MTIKGPVVGDADALIALSNLDDALHDRATKVSKQIIEAGVTLIFPNTAIAEAITTLQSKLNNSKQAHYLHQQKLNGIYTIEYVDEEIEELADGVFDPFGAKHNTYFDAIVAGTAKKYQAEAIFSFDGWYKKKLGFRIASDLL